MVLLILEISLGVYGLAALFTGKLALGAEREARGAIARIAGVVFMLPIPLAIVAALLIGVLAAAQGPNAWQPYAPLWAGLAEWIITLGCGGLGMGIAFAGSVEIESGYRRRDRRRDGADEAPRPDAVEWLDDDVEPTPRKRSVDVRRGTPTGLIAGVLVGAVFVLAATAGIAFWMVAMR